MAHYIEVVVSPIRKSPINSCWIIAGVDVLRQRFSDQSEALKAALTLRGAKRSVIIRPSFNEKQVRKNIEDTHHGYREWRSFNGEQFMEIHFLFGGAGQQTMIRLDNEIVLPPIPMK